MILRILFFCLIGTFSFAQNEVAIQDLDVHILTPVLDKNLSYAIPAKLERKVIDIFTQKDIVNSKESTFAVHTMLDLIEFGKLEGISNEETVQLELSFLIKNRFSDQVFLVFSHKLNGSGKTQKAAVNRAISSIRPQRKVYLTFIEDVQEKVNQYFSEQCDKIIADAQRAIQNNNQEKAIALLYSLPQNSDCKKTNQSLLDQTYNQYQAQHCQSLIQQAETKILKKDYKDAIDILGRIDPNSPCKTEAKQLLQSVTAKVDANTSKKMDFLNKVYKDNVEIEKARQASMKSISNTYIEGIKKD